MTRDYMIQYRESHGMTLQRMARVCKVSVTLLEMLERDSKSVTHPKIASRIAQVYKLSDEQAEGLIPDNYRPHSPNYEPGRYKLEPEFGALTPMYARQEV